MQFRSFCNQISKVIPTSINQFGIFVFHGWQTVKRNLASNVFEDIGFSVKIVLLESQRRVWQC